MTDETYTEGVMSDGAAILCDGQPMTISEILAALNGATIWKTMDSAPQDRGREIIAARFARYDELTAMCEKSPFVSFWMPVRRKFYGEPTHWLCKVPDSFPPVSDEAL